MGVLLGHRLARAGYRVTLIDRPEKVALLLSAGRLTVIGRDGEHSIAVPELITSDASAAGPHDLVVLATKSQDLPAVAADVPALSHDETAVLTIQNGVPWWYLHGLAVAPPDARLHNLDPDGLLDAYVDPARVIGCVAYPAAQETVAGTVLHIEGDRVPIGEIDGAERPRTRAVAAMLERAGFRSRILDDIRSEIWLKALGSLSINPISALTRATMEDICRFAPTRHLATEMMREAQGVAEALGATLRVPIERRIAGAEAVGPHKTSMLQDVEAGRALELDALMGAVMELAELTGLPTPTIRAVHACAALLDATLQRPAVAVGSPA